MAAGLSGPVARNIEENGAIPRVDVVERLAAVLNVSPCALAFGADREAGPTDTAGIGARLKESREHAGLSLSALGLNSGISGQNVANIEARGVMPGVDTAERLAKALGVSPCWLAFGELDAEPARAPAVNAKLRARIAKLAEELKGSAITVADLEPLLQLLPRGEQNRLATRPLRAQPVSDPAGRLR